MSIQNINISQKNITGKCDLKCSYQFKYQESSSTAKNNGVVINLTYDSRSVPSVTYNSQKYNVSNISIVSPSIHIFNNTNMPGEILIEHIPIDGGNILNVCVPFFLSSESSSASDLISEIIKKVSTNAPREGETTNLNLITLEKIVPRKPFYVYNNKTTDYIVFGSIDAIPLSLSTIKTLKQIIKPFALSTPGESLFYNSKGPISGLQLGDGIYISCQPTGSSQEEIPVTYEKNSSSFDFSNITESPVLKLIFLILIGCSLFLLVFYGISILYDKLIIDSPKLSKSSKLT
jgi:carbonic anhydrase